jgi:hypothetical protein
MKRISLLLASAVLTTAIPAHAAVTAAPGWTAYSIPTPGTVQGAVGRPRVVASSAIASRRSGSPGPGT